MIIHSTAERLRLHLSSMGSRLLKEHLAEGLVLRENLVVAILAIVPPARAGEVDQVKVIEGECIDTLTPSLNIRHPISGGILPYAKRWTPSPENRANTSRSFTEERRKALSEAVKSEPKEVRDRKTATLNVHYEQTVNRYNVLETQTGATTERLTSKDASQLVGISIRTFMRRMKATDGESFEVKGFKVTKSFTNPYFTYGGPAQGGSTGFKGPKSRSRGSSDQKGERVDMHPPPPPGSSYLSWFTGSAQASPAPLRHKKRSNV